MLHGIFGVSPDRHNTGFGEHETVAMADGSVVELGAESTILVRLDDTSREVRLINGRALFDVEEDERPFVVVTDLATMTAVGTQFSARTNSWGVEIAVIEGTVSVTSTRDKFLQTQFTGDSELQSDDAVLLNAGQTLMLSTASRGFLGQAAL
jgi:transmembrane sensor